MVKMYGSPLCPDVQEAIQALTSKGIAFEFMDITADLGSLKAFIKLRESNPLFDEVRANDGIGIPCLEKEDGNITFSLKDVL